MFGAAVILSILTQLILAVFSAVSNIKPMEPLPQNSKSVCIFERLATSTLQSKPEGREKRKKGSD
jgi:hypothetical protein